MRVSVASIFTAFSVRPASRSNSDRFEQYSTSTGNGRYEPSQAFTSPSTAKSASFLSNAFASSSCMFSRLSFSTTSSNET